MLSAHKKFKKKKDLRRYFLCRAATEAACPSCRGRIVAWSFFYTVGATLIKWVVGTLTGSKVLVADALHSFTDCAAFGINVFGVRTSRVSVGLQSVLIGAIMFLSGVWICADNTDIILSHIPPRPGLFALLVAGLSILLNGHLYLVSACVHEQEPADGNIFMCMVQNRINFFASCFAFLGILLAVFGLVFLDPAGAVLIGGFQIRGALQIFRKSFGKELLKTASLKEGVSFVLGILTLGIILFFAHDVHDSLNRRKVVLIPAEGTFAESPVSNVLGRAPYFVIIDSRHQLLNAYPNHSRFYNVKESIVLDAIVKNNYVGVVLANKIGPDMFASLRTRGVRIYYIDRPGTVGAVFSAYQNGLLPLATSANVAQGFGRRHIHWMAPW